MLLHLLLERPQMIGSILSHTPSWVWGLFAGLLFLGFTQARDRTVGLARTAIMPVAMTAFSIWGMAGAFGASPDFGYLLLAWIAAGTLTVAAVGMMTPPAGARYDAWTRTFSLPGSWLPLAMIVGIFLTRYWVNVEIAINPMVKSDGAYTLTVAALYGFFSGIFAGRALRLAKLAWGGSARAAVA